MASAIESGSPVAAAGVLVPTRRPAALWSEPYRAFFLFGSIYGSIVFALWGWQLLALGQGAALSGFSLSAAGHVRLVLWGVLGSYVFGFSLTAYPKQNDGDLLAPRPLH
ncbi:MAG TPA: NnrS family protein, partial [Gammaproteobacteria bacterium]|nr:NnrS family protein [Gammaproteobacteria bacterium]